VEKGGVGKEGWRGEGCGGGGGGKWIRCEREEVDEKKERKEGVGVSGFWVTIWLDLTSNVLESLLPPNPCIFSAMGGVRVGCRHTGQGPRAS